MRSLLTHFQTKISLQHANYTSLHFIVLSVAVCATITAFNEYLPNFLSNVSSRIETRSVLQSHSCLGLVY